MQSTNYQLAEAFVTRIAEADAIRAAWAWIKERRAQSDVEEKAIFANE
jgi:hypothetical protein